jgi:hypothetical protein
MNKKQLFLTLLILFLTVFFIPMGSLAEPPRKHMWEISTETSYIRNKTMGFSRIPVLKSHAVLYGLGLSYTYNGTLPVLSPKINNCMLKIEGNGSLGRVDNDYVWDDTKEHILEFRGLAGYNFSISNKSVVAPYTGLGYRYLKMDKAGVWNENKFTYLYIPIGIEMDTELGKKWSIGTKLEYDYFLWGEVHVNDKDILGNKYDQEHGYGLRGFIRFYKKTNKADFSVEPFLKYWNIKESETLSIASVLTGRTLNNGSAYTMTRTYPKNHSTELGVKFAVRF